MTFGYDANRIGAGLYTIRSIGDKALHLSDDLVDHRRGRNVVLVFIHLILDRVLEAGNELICLLCDTGRPLVFVTHDLGGTYTSQNGKMLQASQSVTRYCPQKARTALSIGMGTVDRNARK